MEALGVMVEVIFCSSWTACWNHVQACCTFRFARSMASVAWRARCFSTASPRNRSPRSVSSSGTR
jgi:hypothetical protein